MNWKEWKGGERPVDSDVVVEVKFRDGDSRVGSQARAARCWIWRHTGKISREDIVAYRIAYD